MRTPTWLREQIADEGSLLTPGQPHPGPVAKLTNAVMERDDVLVRALVEQFVTRTLDRWLSDHTAPLDEDDEQPSLFLGLPRKLETSPGRFADLEVMTGPDWDAALRQAEVKASNAGGHLDLIRRAYDQVRPLLTVDTLTTAEVADRLSDRTEATA